MKKFLSLLTIISTFMFYNVPYALGAGSISPNGTATHPGGSSGSYTVPTSATGSTLVFVIADSVASNPTITCGGVTMKTTSAIVNTHSTNNMAVEYTTACPSGSQTITSSSGEIYIFSYTGVNSVTPIEASTTQSKVTNPSFTISTSVANDWLVGMVNGNNVVSCGSGCTLRDAVGGPSFGDSNGGLSAGSNTIQFNIAAGQVGGGFAFAIEPVTVAATNLNFWQVF